MTLRVLRCAAVAVLTTCIFSGGAYAEPTQDLGLLTTASSQRMHGQRVVSSYAQLFLSVQSDKASAALKQSLADLRSNNASLRQGAPATAVPLLEQQLRLVDQLAGVVAQPPVAASLGQAQKVGDELLGNAEAVLKACAAASSSSAPAALLMMASRQRMLSQRLSALYFLQLTPLKSVENKKRMVAADEEFNGVIAAFDDHKNDFPGIGTNMDLARMQMVFFDNAVHNVDGATPEQMRSVSTSSDRILGQMDELTRNVQKRLAEQMQPIKAAKK